MRMTFMNYGTIRERGQALAELILAMSIVAILVPFFLGGITASRDGRVQEEVRQRAHAILQEKREAIRSVRSNGWSNIAANGTYRAVNDGQIWFLQAGTEVVSGFSVSIVISSVQRTVDGQIVPSGGTIDPATRQVQYTVSWGIPSPGGSITAREYLTRYNNNAALSQTTFGNGSRSNTRLSTLDGGSIELSPVTGTLSFAEEFADEESQYTFDNSVVEVVDGYAQLKQLANPVSGASTNGALTTNMTGWTYGEWGNTNRVSGGWTSTGGNPTGNVQISYTSTVNQAAGGYFRQTITNTAINPTATLSFQWSVSQWTSSGPPDSFRVYAWLDTTSGAPTPANAVWSSAELTGLTSWAGTGSIDMSSRMLNPGTYYLKVGAYLDYRNVGSQGPFQVRFDNIAFTWSGFGTPVYSTAQPSVVRTESFASPYLNAFTGFAATEVANGGSIRYQVSNDDGATWWWYSGSWQQATLSTHYMTASTLNQRINSFPAANKQIAVRAFLISSGTQFVRLDRFQVNYNADVAPSGTNTGTFTSATLDAGAIVAMNRLQWVGYQPAGTTIQFQFANNTGGNTWTYVGPDNTSATYFTGDGGMIPIPRVNARYLRYRIFFSSTVADLPRVSEVYINYAP